MHKRLKKTPADISSMRNMDAIAAANAHGRYLRASMSFDRALPSILTASRPHKEPSPRRTEAVLHKNDAAFLHCICSIYHVVILQFLKIKCSLVYDPVAVAEHFPIVSFTDGARETWLMDMIGCNGILQISI